MVQLLLLLATLTFTSRVSASDDARLSAAISALPPCAGTCIAKAIATKICRPTDQVCICTEPSFIQNVETCILASCTIEDGLATKNITTRTCGAPTRDKSERTRRTNIVLSVITASIGVTRLIFNAIHSPTGWTSDDYSLLAILIAGAPSVVIIDRMSLPNGLGKDVWTVPFHSIMTFVRSIYALEILYFIQIVLVKMTLLLFFWRIFPRRTTETLIKGTIAFNVLFGIVFTIIAIFPCRPISYFWKQFDGQSQRGRCIDINALVWTNAAISIVLDVWMLALPLYEVFRLQMSWRKRISVALMFFVGTFVTIVSMVRLRFLLRFAKGHNPTWDQADVVNWSNIEINVGIICACMPCMRVALTRVFPRLLGSTMNHSALHDARNPERSVNTAEIGHPFQTQHETVFDDRMKDQNTSTYENCTVVLEPGRNEDGFTHPMRWI